MLSLLQIKNKLLVHHGLRFIIYELAIMLVFFSLIYKQSILSFILLIAVVYYIVLKFSHKNPTALVRYVTVAVILIQYLMALTNLTSYNSPSPFPHQLRMDGDVSTVYPNPTNWFLSNPWYFDATNEVSDRGEPKITVKVCNFFGIPVAGRMLNGMWIDFLVVVIMYFYLNNYNMWLLNK